MWLCIVAQTRQTGVVGVFGLEARVFDGRFFLFEF